MLRSCESCGEKEVEGGQKKGAGRAGLGEGGGLTRARRAVLGRAVCRAGLSRTGLCRASLCCASARCAESSCVLEDFLQQWKYVTIERSAGGLCN